MAVQRRLRMALRIVAASCLVAGLFPYCSHTSGPPPEADFPPIDLPVVGRSPIGRLPRPCAWVSRPLLSFATNGWTGSWRRRRIPR
jgi:hypothetical protein